MNGVFRGWSGGCPLAALDGEAFNRQVVMANVVAGEGLFVSPASASPALQGLQVPFQEHDLAVAMPEDHPS